MGNTPNIRFKGYTDDWEQRNLGAVVEDYVEKTTVEDQYPVLTSSQQKGIVLQDDYFSGDRVSQNGNVGYFIIPRGYFAFRSRSDNDVFVFNRNDVADMGIISYFYPVFKPKGVDSDFLLRRLNYGLEDQIKINSEGTGQHVLSLKKFKNMVGLFPSYEEQKKVGSYFSKIDNLISRHQQEYDNMAALKKYMLQKMFPANGEKVPEIRFEGFTDLWEQRKFKELCDMVTVGIANSATQAYSDSGVPMFRNQNIKPNFLDDADIIYIKPEFEAQYKNKRLKINDLLVARTGYPGTACVVPRKYENSQTFTTLIARPKKRVNSHFLCQYLNSDVGVKYFESTQIGGGQKNSGAGILNEMPVTLPQNINEAKEIADYFADFDHLITLHQRKRDELLELKKYMLQNMFPKKEG